MHHKHTSVRIRSVNLNYHFAQVRTNDVALPWGRIFRGLARAFRFPHFRCIGNDSRTMTEIDQSGEGSFFRRLDHLGAVA